MLGWARCDFHKKRTRARSTELVFLHPVGSVGHIVHSGASGLRNIDALFFMIGWGQGGFRRKRVGTRYVEVVLLHSVGFTGHVVDSSAFGPQKSTPYFSCSGGPSVISIRSAPGHVPLNLCFCIWWDLWVTVHFGASGLQNIDALFFKIGWGQGGIYRKRVGTRYVELVLLHSVGFAGHVVDSGGFGPQKSTPYFSCSGGPSVISIRSAQGHVPLNLCFCIQWDLKVKWCVPMRSGRETITHYFLCLGGTDAVSIESVLQLDTLN
jgi:hypothetical protein